MRESKSSLLELFAQQMEARSLLPVAAVPRPPRHVDAGEAPATPKPPRGHWVTRVTSGVTLVVSASSPVAGIATPARRRCVK